MAKRKRDRIVDSRKRHNENLGQGSSMQPASESLPRNLEQPNSMQATTTHVQNIVEQSVTEEENVFGVERQNKNQRGPTLMSWIWELEKDRYLSVGLDRDGMPIGVEGGHLFQFMGSMVRMRNLAPINYKRYPDMPQRLKDAMWDIILSKFKFIPFFNETTEVMLKKEIGEKWRTWKSELKRKWYDASLTPAQMWAELKDDRVDKVQFIALANFWCSPEGQALSDRNQKNCKKLQEPHCTGTKTLARLRHEMAIAAGGIYTGNCCWWNLYSQK